MSGSILQKIVRVSLLALFALLQASPAAAGAPQRFVVFGDSLSDPGNAFVLVRDVEVPPFDNLIPDAAQFDAGLEAILLGLESGSGLNIVRFDVFKALNEVVAAPEAFGLTNVTQPCIAVDTNAQPFCAKSRHVPFLGRHPSDGSRP